MILFFGNGRVGNQLFQYYGLKKNFPNERLIFFGFEDLNNWFDNIDVYFISKEVIQKWISFVLFRKLIIFLARIHFLGRVTEKTDEDIFKLDIRRGLIPGIFVPENVFFQHFDVVSNVINPPTLKIYLLNLARNWLKIKGLDPEKNTLTFLHIRRGDYVIWPSREFPAVLGIEWYRRMIDLIYINNSKTILVLMSDDHYYLRDLFNESELLVISDCPQEIDLAIMSLCSSGILSASSFAWWGAFYAHKNNKEQKSFIAPKFWAGHRSKKWYPKNFHSEWLEYIE